VILGAVQPHIQVDDFLSYVSRQTLTKTISVLLRVAHQNKQVHTTQTNTLPAVDWFHLKLPLPFVPMSFILSGHAARVSIPHSVSHTKAKQLLWRSPPQISVHCHCHHASCCYRACVCVCVCVF